MQRSQRTTTTYSRDKINFLCVRQKNTTRKATSTRHTYMQRSQRTTTTYSRDKINFLCVRQKNTTRKATSTRHAAIPTNDYNLQQRQDKLPLSTTKKIQHERPQARDIPTFRDMQRSQRATTTYSRDKINFLCVRQKNTTRKATSTRHTYMQRSQ